MTGLPFSDGIWTDSNVGRVLTNALARYERRVLENLAELGYKEVRLFHINVIRNLDLSGTITTELARRSGITRQAMSEIVAQCEELGLVERVPDQRDARAKIVHYTAEGQRWLKAFLSSLATVEQEMRDEIGYLRTDAIIGALNKYGKEYDKFNFPAEPSDPNDWDWSSE